MDCREVKNLLSEYIDQVLAEDTAALVGEHLDMCANCTGTYESMTRLIGYMKNMETVDEPESLLDDVKARLEKRFSWAGLFRQVYSPPYVKIPIELAVVAAILVFVVHMPGIGGGPELYEITFAFDSKKDVQVVEKGESGKIRLDENMEDLSVTSAEVMATGAREKGGREEAEGKLSAEAPRKSATAPEASKLEISQPEEKAKMSPAPTSDAIIEIPKKRSQSQAALEKRGKNGDREEDPLLDVIRSVGGKTVESEYEEGRSRVTALTVEIPAENYQTFLNELAKLGEVGIDIPVPADVSGRKGTVTIRIHLR